MNIVMLTPESLTGYGKNARTHSKEQIDQIVNSIKEFGFNVPVEVNSNFMILSGHARVEAAKKMGLKEIPVIIQQHLVEENSQRGYILAANKIAMNADWDYDILSEELCALENLDFDITLTGFSQKELDEMIDKMDFKSEEVDEIPEDSKIIVSAPGDLWILGSHRLFCGDSTVSTDVEYLLNGEYPNTMVTDPPYGVKLDMSWRDKAVPGNATNNKNLVKNDDRADWYDTYILFPGDIAYVWHASAFTDVVMANLRDAGFEIKQQIIWRKTQLVLGRSNYHRQHEPCWYAVRKGGNSSWKGDRKQTTVWDFDSPNRSNSSSNDDKTEHPTQKPVELFARSILHHTNPGEYVYDPFAGSGTLMMACEKTKRRALMMELDNKYADIIIQRYQNFTGKQAIHEKTGKTWDELRSIV